MRKLVIILSMITLIGVLAACGIKGPPVPPSDPEPVNINEKTNAAQP